MSEPGDLWVAKLCEDLAVSLSEKRLTESSMALRTASQVVAKELRKQQGEFSLERQLAAPARIINLNEYRSVFRIPPKENNNIGSEHSADSDT